MQLIRGDQLTDAQRVQVLAAFVHRNTVEHPYGRAAGRRGKPTDARWLSRLAFWFTRRDQLASRRHAEPISLAPPETPCAS